MLIKVPKPIDVHGLIFHKKLSVALWCILCVKLYEYFWFLSSVTYACILACICCVCTMITSAEGGYVFTLVCLFVCLSVSPSDNWKSCERILAKFLGGVGHGPGTKGINFGDDLDQRPDPGVRCLKSVFTGLSKKLLKDFDEILWTAGVWPGDQLITFWWRSASLTGSGSPFRITIRIRELPRCQHTQNRCPQCSPPAEWIYRK